jgi:hypothetical protein
LEEEAAEIASTIKVKSQFIQGGEIHGLLTMVIPEDVYRLEIEDADLSTKNPSVLNCTIQISQEEKMNMIEKCWKWNTARLRITINAISVFTIIWYKNSSIAWMQHGWHN